MSEPQMQDFYPTPKPLITRMLEGFGSLDEYGPVLEPSAGKGDIADHLAAMFRYQKQADIDVIELNPDLAHVLRGKGYNLVHDDFLTFESPKRYGLIVANFPFSEGDKHLAKALRMLERDGGELRCLVNAETVRNPYTNLRRAILGPLEYHGAEVEYIADAFRDAERQTGVEVALIKLAVPQPKRSSIILDALQQSQDVIRDDAGPTALAETDVVRSLLSRFQLECEAGIRLIDEYRALRPLMLRDLALPGSKTPYTTPIVELTVNGSSRYSGDTTNDYLRATRRKYWAALLSSDRISGVYTSNVLDELHNRLDDLRNADFTEFNIRQLYADLQRSVSTGVEDAIIAMFDEFSRKYAWEKHGTNIHFYNGWKTNQSYRVNRKIILPINGFSAYAPKDRLDSYYIAQRLADMVKAFNYLAGDLPDAAGLASRAIELANDATTFRNVDFHYFTATFYKKGTCHITFSDQKLLDKFNIYGSQRKGWLPPGYGKRPYRDMSPEEQEVINQFQGETAYSDVVRDAAYYLSEPAQLMLGEGVAA